TACCADAAASCVAWVDRWADSRSLGAPSWATRRLAGMARIRARQNPRGKLKLRVISDLLRLASGVGIRADGELDLLDRLGGSRQLIVIRLLAKILPGLFESAQRPDLNRVHFEESGVILDLVHEFNEV